ncbi:Mechanosensitive channel MscK precursor [compost metagenome]
MQDFVLRYKAVDADINKAIIRIGILQGRVVRLNLDVDDRLDEINYQIRNFKKIIFSKEAPYLWEPTSMQSKTLMKVMKFSVKKNKLIANYYLESNWPSHMFILFLIALMVFITIRAFRLIDSTVLKKISKQVKHIYLHQITSAIFIVIVPAQFFYSDSPMIYLEFLWLVMVLLGSYIFWGDARPQYRAIWPLILLLFGLAVLDNLLLEVSRQERWGLFVMGCAGLILSIYMIRISTVLKSEYKILIWVFFIQLAIGVIANPLGRYSLAKLMVDGSYFNLIAGICLVWWIRLVSEFLFVQTEANKSNEKLTAYINFDHLQKVIRPMLGILGLIGWFLILAKNLDVYDLVIEDISNFLSKERKVGSIDFTLGSVLIFFIIIWVASIIASIVSYMLGASQGQKIRKSRFGSIGLILRLTILALGFLVAIAAAGIPLDKVTIIIGALGVGIGFGLQNIVNNLVSGVILAFEKPISVGDQIEVGTNTGTVKEIGIRSSKMVTFDGAEIVIPNGDMLNQHLINWTLSNNNRRVEILVGVKYGSDLEKVKAILLEILNNRKEILTYPPPLVLVTGFGDSSINYRILFWTAEFNSWTLIKSEIIIAIDKEFKGNNIEIPFPQQDVFIKNLQEKNEDTKEVKEMGKRDV